MSNTKTRGRHGVIIRNPHKPDWPTDGQVHAFAAAPHPHVCLLVTKAADGRLCVELFDVFDQSFVFLIPPQPDTYQTNGVSIECEWENGEVRLYANKELAATQRAAT